MKQKKKDLAPCSKCGYEFSESMVRKCPSEAVTRLVGPYICLYCCRKCKYNKQVTGGSQCELKILEGS